MKRILIYLLLVVSMAVFAQQQTESPQTENTEAKQAVTDEQQAESEAPVSDVADDGAEISSQEAEEAYLDLDEVIDPDETPFEPEEEISEDYPIPLPSDI